MFGEIALVRRYKAVLLVATALALSSACASVPVEEKPPERLIDEPPPARILFESAKDVFAEQGIQSALVAEEAMVIASQWSQVNRELRHRIMVRVAEVHGGRGVSLTVTSEYLRRKIDAGEEFWIPAQDQLTKQRKSKDELEMGKAIKERYEERRE